MTENTRSGRRRKVVLFQREGASMASSWEDVIELTRHKGGVFTLRITGVPFCREDGRPWVAFESAPFRTSPASGSVARGTGRPGGGTGAKVATRASCRPGGAVPDREAISGAVRLSRDQAQRSAWLGR